MKKQLGLRIEARLKEGLDERSQRTGTPATAILEDYIEKGLARDSGELIEQNSLPAIREAVREEVGKAIAQLYQQLSADLQKSAKRSDDRLVALIVKAVRNAGIGQRMIQTLIGKLVDRKYAAEAYESAKELTGKDLARPDETKSGEGRT